MTDVKVYGIRHHGPGCAKALAQALESFRPDIVAIEGPADAGDVLALANEEAMKPPVALLLYEKERPGQATFYPMAVFSPEWQALRYAQGQGTPVQFMDLPSSMQAPGVSAKAPDEPDTPNEEGAESEVTPEAFWREDPIAVLAQAAGFEDRELWWEEQIERREGSDSLFEAILEAMCAVRAEFQETGEETLRREAFMRKTLRGLMRAGPDRLAVVCGAWHAPVLTEDHLKGKVKGTRVTEDTQRLRGLKKVRTCATWIPWTHDRLARRSGYGAGIESPGWYESVWESSADAPTRFLVQAARLLRSRDLEASSASAIEALRLAESLAALRSLRSPGLRELGESIQSVFCRGESAPLALIKEHLEVGHVLGSVPEHVPTVPLLSDLERQQKRLRFKPTTELKTVEFDLRKDAGRERSRLLHRLQLLSVPWGELSSSGSRTSTFKEVWSVRWKPDYVIALIEANGHGGTIEEAASGLAIEKTERLERLEDITALFEVVMLAALERPIDPLLTRMQAVASRGGDVLHLMKAALPLARVSRYGDVRGTRTSSIIPILHGLLERILVGLAQACRSLTEEAARHMLSGFEDVSRTLALIEREDLERAWFQELAKLPPQELVNPMVRGFACRALLERRLLQDEDLERYAVRALSPAQAPEDATQWLSGLLRGSGLLLLGHETLWHLFDEWLCGLREETFVATLPLLRRAFADFSRAERRQMAGVVKSLRRDAPAARENLGVRRTGRNETPLDLERAARVLPILRELLGTPETKDE